MIALAPAAQATEVGISIAVDPANLPPPHATGSAYNGPRELERPAGVVPVAPPGFAVNLFADGLAHPLEP